MHVRFTESWNIFFFFKFLTEDFFLFQYYESV